MGTNRYSEQRIPPRTTPWRSEVLKGAAGSHAPAWRAVEEAGLHQIWFVDFLDGVRLFVGGRGNRVQSALAGITPRFEDPQAPNRSVFALGDQVDTHTKQMLPHGFFSQRRVPQVDRFVDGGVLPDNAIHVVVRQRGNPAALQEERG